MQKALGVSNPIVLSYLSDLYCGRSELQGVTVTRIEEEQFLIFSLGALLRAARVGAVEWLSFDLMIAFCKSRDAISRFTSLLIEEWFLFGNLLAF